MKNILSYLLAGIFGGLVVLGGLQVTQQTEEPTSTVRFASNTLTNISPSANVPFDFTKAAELAMPAVVHISAAESRETAQESDPFSFFFGEGGNPFNYGPKEGTGSGVIYSADGYIVTNNHVVEFADEISVTLYDNRKFNATVVGMYPQSDLAVLKIEASGLPTMEVANSETAKVGQWVLAVGNPFDLTSTVTAGIISAKGRDINIIRENNAIETFIQTDAAVNPGNSGGALVNAEGKLLGINTAIASRTGSYAGYAFAIPVNVMQRIVDDIIENGSYQRVMLGIGVSELDADYANELGINVTQGVLVESLTDGGSAQYAGILPQDIIVEANNVEVRTFPDLQEVVSSSKVGDTLLLKINRKGKILEIPVQLKAG